MACTRLVLLALVGLLGLPPCAAQGDVFLLVSGGQVVGELLNPDEAPRKTWVIRSSAGGQITLDAKQVKEVVRQSPEQVEYAKIRPTYPDTVAGHWALAEWCRQRHLPAERKTQLERIIELDPNHVAARRALGFGQVDGQWKTQTQSMVERGYILYKGQWRLPQQMELMEQKQKQDATEKEWFKKLKLWRGWLDGDRALVAQANIRAIDDPLAVKALGRALADDPRREARVLFIEVLSKISTKEAIEALAVCSIEDPDEETRLTCLDCLQPHKTPQLVAYYVGKLRDKDNRIVNLAGVALSRIQDSSAIQPLIDALVTTHKFKMTNGQAPGSISTTFSNTGGSGISMNTKPVIVSQRMTNQAVLDALVSLTRVNFSFDVTAWQSWYAQQKKRTELDARRD